MKKGKLKLDENGDMIITIGVQKQEGDLIRCKKIKSWNGNTILVAEDGTVSIQNDKTYNFQYIGYLLTKELLLAVTADGKLTLWYFDKTVIDKADDILYICDYYVIYRQGEDIHVLSEYEHILFKSIYLMEELITEERIEVLEYYHINDELYIPKLQPKPALPIIGIRKDEKLVAYDNTFKTSHFIKKVDGEITCIWNKNHSSLMADITVTEKENYLLVFLEETISSIPMEGKKIIFEYPDDIADMYLLLQSKEGFYIFNVMQKKIFFEEPFHEIRYSINDDMWYLLDATNQKTLIVDQEGICLIEIPFLVEENMECINIRDEDDYIWLYKNCFIIRQTCEEPYCTQFLIRDSEELLPDNIYQHYIITSKSIYYFNRLEYTKVELQQYLEDTKTIVDGQLLVMGNSIIVEGKVIETPQVEGEIIIREPRRDIYKFYIHSGKRCRTYFFRKGDTKIYSQYSFKGKKYKKHYSH